MVDFATLQGGRIVTADIETAYGLKISIPFQLMSWEEWDTIGREVIDPPPPRTRIDPTNPENLLPNPEDTRYKEVLADNVEKRFARRIIRPLERGGNTFPVEGDEVDKLRYLRTLDNAVFKAITEAVTVAALGGKVKVSEIADSFREE